MKAPAALLFVLCPLHSAAASETPTSLHLLKSYPDATCLDGSPAAYYLREGSGSNADKWAFSLEGGGECVTQSECDDRKNGNLGSSANYPSTTTLHSTLQTSDASINPNFHDYNQVFVKYCTGDLHMGQQTASSPPTLDGVYFAGHHVVAAVIKDLMASNNLADAAEVVWSGESAGGMGCFNSLDFVADTLADAGSAATVVGVPVGGFYYPNDWPYVRAKRARLHSPPPPPTTNAHGMLAGTTARRRTPPRTTSRGRGTRSPCTATSGTRSFPPAAPPPFLRTPSGACSRLAAPTKPWRRPFSWLRRRLIRS